MSGQKPKLYDTQLEKEEFNSVLDELLLGDVKAQFKKELSGSAESLKLSHQKLVELHEIMPAAIGEAVEEIQEKLSKEMRSHNEELLKEISKLKEDLGTKSSNSVLYILLILNMALSLYLIFGK